jgi:hypothetical protein
MAAHLGWDENKKAAEIASLDSLYRTQG